MELLSVKILHLVDENNKTWLHLVLHTAAAVWAVLVSYLLFFSHTYKLCLALMTYVLNNCTMMQKTDLCLKVLNLQTLMYI